MPSNSMGTTSSHPQRLIRRDQDGSRGWEWLCEEVLGVDRRPGSELLVIVSGELLQSVNHVVVCKLLVTPDSLITLDPRLILLLSAMLGIRK